MVLNGLILLNVPQPHPLFQATLFTQNFLFSYIVLIFLSLVANSLVVSSPISPSIAYLPYIMSFACPSVTTSFDFGTYYLSLLEVRGQKRAPRYGTLVDPERTKRTCNDDR